MKAIIFDLDGTLIDSRADIAAALNHSRRHFGLPEHSLENVIPMIGKGLPHLIQMGFKDAPQHVEEAIEQSTEYYQSSPSHHTTSPRAMVGSHAHLHTSLLVLAAHC